MGVLCYSVVKEQSRLQAEYGSGREDFSLSLLSTTQSPYNETHDKKFLIYSSNCRLYLRITCSDAPYFSANFAVQRHGMEAVPSPVFAVGHFNKHAVDSTGVLNAVGNEIPGAVPEAGCSFL